MTKKRLLNIVSFLSILLLTLSIAIPKVINVVASGTANISYSLSKSEIKPGDTFDINVNISNVTDLYSASIDFKFDPNLFSVQQVVKGGIWQNQSINEGLLVDQRSSGYFSYYTTLVGDRSGLTTSGTLFTIKAKALANGKQILKTINSDAALSVNGNNVRIKLSNSKNSNQKINYSASDAQIIIMQYPIQYANIEGRYEESSEFVKFSGTWSNHYNPSVSGGQGKLSTTAGSYVEFNFTGTSIKWISYYSKDRGIAKVYIDGVYDKTVDTSKATDETMAVVYEKYGLSNSEHTIKIEVTGTKSSSSNSALIYVDAFDFSVEAYPTIRVEESSNSIKYSGSWSNHYNSAVSSGQGKLSTTAGSYAEFTFTGTSIKWISYYSKDRGIAKVYIDGVYDKSVDTSKPTDMTKAVVYEKSGLSYGQHTIRIEVTGTKSSGSNSPLIYIDAFDFAVPSSSNVSTVRFEETSPYIKYSGIWSNHTNPAVSGGQGMLSTTTGSYAEFTFTGTSIKWISYYSKNRGIAKVYIDGVYDKSVDTSRPNDETKVVVYEKTGLENKEHTIRIEVTGNKSSGSTSPLIYIDAFDFTVNSESNDTLIRFEDNSKYLKFSGNWSNHYNSAVSGGTGKLSATAGSYVEFKFTGTSIQWISYYSKDRGIAKVYIDGVFDKLVDTSRAINQTKAVVYRKTGLSNGVHTIKIEVTGTKSSGSNSAQIYIDAFDFAVSPISTVSTARFEETASFVKYIGTWSNHTNPKVSGGTGKLSTQAGSYVEFTFTGTSVKWISYYSKDRGIAKVYIDGIYDKTVDTSKPTDTTKAIVYEKNGLANKEHTIRVEVTGTKSSASISPLIYIDAFDFTFESTAK